MRTASFAVLLSAVAACGPFTEPDVAAVSDGDDSLVPAPLRAEYREDAARLALRHLMATDDPAVREVELPAALVESLYSALIHVHNATGLAARDSVVERYRIHTFPNPEVLRVTLMVDSTAAWVQALRRGERPTGNAPFDRLVETYGLTLQRYYDLQFINDLAALQAGAPLNAPALARLFVGIDGVLNASPEGWVGDGNDIRASAAGEAWQLDYKLGFGDCPAGCTGSHVWQFRVAADGHVTFLGSSGPLP